MLVLLRRHGDGIGDWMFMLAAIKHINRQHPDVEISVDFKLEPIGNRKRELPQLVIDAYRASDVRWMQHSPHRIYRRTVQHVVYDRHASSTSYIEGMVQQLAKELDRPLEYDPTLLPVFKATSRLELGPCFVMPSQSKRATAHKDWGINKFERLAADIHTELGAGVTQIGAPEEYRLQGGGVSHELGVDFDRLCWLIRAASAFIGLENGLAVLARMLGAPTCVIYHGLRTNPGRMIPGCSTFTDPEPAQILSYCKAVLDASRTMRVRAST